MKKYIVISVILSAVLIFTPGYAGKDIEAEDKVYISEEPLIGRTSEPRKEIAYTLIRIDAEDTYISEEYQRYSMEIGKKYNICPELLMAMIEQESSGQKNASNSTGDTGLLQVNPKWHADRMIKLGVTDLYDPYSNILVAADYLAELFQENEDVYLVLMKYNMVHSTAEELYEKGVYSQYAIDVSERAWELEMIHDQEGE